MRGEFSLRPLRPRFGETARTGLRRLLRDVPPRRVRGDGRAVIAGRVTDVVDLVGLLGLTPSTAALSAAPTGA